LVGGYAHVFVLLFVVIVTVTLLATLLSGCSAPDLCLTGVHFVAKLSAAGLPTRPTQPSIPPGSINE